MDLTKRNVRKLLGLTYDREIAEFFGIGKAAVSLWDEDSPIPKARQWQLRARRPDLFTEGPPGRRRSSAAKGKAAEADGPSVGSLTARRAA